MSELDVTLRDGRTLHVSDISGGETWSFDVQADGALTNKRLVCSFGSDGMTLDDQGNLYLSANARPPGVTMCALAWPRRASVPSSSRTFSTNVVVPGSWTLKSSV